VSFKKQTIRDVPLRAKKVLLRADYNVPLNDDGTIASDYRIVQSLETIKFLLEQSVKLVIVSHLGRPDGKENPKYSLAQVAKRLSELLGQPVKFAEDCVGREAQDLKDNLKPKEVLLLENLRFHDEEENNNREFAEKLADGMDLFVQDGFGVVHRAHASTDAVTQFLPGVSGLLLEREVGIITTAMEDPQRPLMAIIGGAKISDKIELINKFIEVADFVAVGGAMATTFLKALGHDVGNSLVENDKIDVARDIIEKAKAKERAENFTFYIPQDGVVTKKIDSNTSVRIVDWASHTYADVSSYPKIPGPQSHTVAKDEMIVDIGPASSHYIAGALHAVKTVIWNGTMGITETAGLAGGHPPFGHGTRVIYEALTSDPGSKPYSVIGGGETAAYVMDQPTPKSVHAIDHVSTGGGAGLELMAGKKLPGVEALKDKQ
jgi:3-phosphoglycerate kinase